jgi:hypothetical protein
MLLFICVHHRKQPARKNEGIYVPFVSVDVGEMKRGRAGELVWICGARTTPPVATTRDFLATLQTSSVDPK